MPSGKPKKARQCKRCGETFQPTNGLQKFCGPKCWLDYVPKEPMFGRCRTCGEHYEKSRQDQKYCSARCRGRAKGRRLTSATRQPRGWNLATKGEEGCRNCGRFAEHLHHIVPRGKTTRGRAEVAKNGMPLCFDCHRGWHDRRVKIHASRLTDEELAFAVEYAGVLWVEQNYPDEPHVALMALDEAVRDRVLDPTRQRSIAERVELVGLGEAYRRVTA